MDKKTLEKVPSEKFTGSVSLLAWGLNEECLLEEFLDKAFSLLRKNVVDFEVVFVNDGSTDRTAKILEQYQGREPRLKVITNSRTLNVGLSCRKAIQGASKEYLFWQTVDWSYDLSDIRVYLELLKYYDVVQGIRPVPQRLLSHIPFLRSIYRVRKRSDNVRKAVVSLSNYYVQRLFFGVQFSDFQNVTFYPTKLIKSLGLRARTPFLNPEMLIKAYYRGSRFIEVPISFIPRTKGKAKGTRLLTILGTIQDIVRNWLRWGWRARFTSSSETIGQIDRVANANSLPIHIVRLVLPLIQKTWVGLYWEQVQRVMLEQFLSKNLGEVPTTRPESVQEHSLPISVHQQSR